MSRWRAVAGVELIHAATQKALHCVLAPDAVAISPVRFSINEAMFDSWGETQEICRLTHDAVPHLSPTRLVTVGWNTDLPPDSLVELFLEPGMLMNPIPSEFTKGLPVLIAAPKSVPGPPASAPAKLQSRKRRRLAAMNPRTRIGETQSVAANVKE